MDYFTYYPDADEVDRWVDSLWEELQSVRYEAAVLEQRLSQPHAVPYLQDRYIRFDPVQEEGRHFYALWQPTFAQSAPLLVHLPGYGAEISAFPDLVLEGYHVLHISPMGYNTPDGPNEQHKVHDTWPVLPDTVSSGGVLGYREWLLHCMTAITWALEQPGVAKDRLSFFGSSQGGGGALLLGSVYRDRGTRCVAADIPFLTNFPLGRGRGAYRAAEPGFEAIEDPAVGWRALGFIDTLSHAERLAFPVLLTSGGADDVTPPDTIESLFERLPHTRSYTKLHESGHLCTYAFMKLAASWFRLYA